MQIPLSWIQEFVELDKTPQEIEAAFNQLGIEVEGVTTPGADVVGVRAVKIIDVNPHPDADRLRLADIDLGDEQRRIVCGAPKLEVGMMVPYAASGVTLPNGMTLDKRKIRGVVSDGMLCSPAELGVSEDHASGLLELPAEAEVGQDVGELLGKGEVVFEFSITPNRPDAMCVTGLARDLAAYFKLDLKKQSHIAAPIETSNEGSLAEITVSNAERCPRYIGWLADVKVGPSPKWMAERLTLAGLRPVNNVVDVTNYVLLEYNQPLHAFDFDVVGGIHVRNATSGESVVTLDGKSRTLTDEDLLICDAQDRPQAIAGVMGAQHSEITEKTTRILLEAAYFEPVGIGFTSRRLGLRTDASSRFDRGIDPNGVAGAAARAMELLIQVADAKVQSHFADTNPEPVARKVLDVRINRVNRLIGIDITGDEMSQLLTPIGFEVEVADADMKVAVPTFRPDVTREIDVVEEVARMYGYSNVTATLTNRSFHRGALTREQQNRRAIGQVMIGLGFDEAKCFPLVAPSEAELFGTLQKDRIAVANPLREDESIVTSTLLPGLLKSVRLNLSRGAKDVALFETDRVFEESNEELPKESVSFAAVACGARDERPLGDEKAYDAFTMTSALNQLVAELKLTDVQLKPAMVIGFDADTSHAVLVDGKEAGAVGLIDKRVASYFGITEPVAAMELATEVLANASRKPRLHKAPSVQPPSFFDLAFLVDKSVTAADLTSTVYKAGGERVESARVFDLYEGSHVPKGKKSIAIAITVRDATDTLTDKDIHQVRDACIAAASKRLGAELRGE